jgi:myosin heavy subunit
MQVVEIRRRGYSVRYPHAEFIRKYAPLIRRNSISSSSSSSSSAAPAITVHELAHALTLAGHGSSGSVPGSSNGFHVGTSKVFLKTAAQRQLDVAREEQVRT